jgi:leucine dehydrogenase
MDSLKTHADFDDHEKVLMLADEATGLAGIICIHSTALGPAMGGCRKASYDSPEAALTDALRLARGMSYKNAVAGLPAGGGKSVLYKFGTHVSRDVVWNVFAEAVENLGGRYVTAEDVGTTVADMEMVARRTRHVAGLPRSGGRAGGDPSPWTALGVFVALKASAGRPLLGARVAIQGLGAVGYKLCELLHRAGARLVVADIDAERTARAAHEFGAETVPVDRIHAAYADVFSPNALGGILNSETISELGAPIVCGGANNQLSAALLGRDLLSRSVTYVPDYVANAGGIISVTAEYLGKPADSVKEQVLAIAERVTNLLSQAREQARPSNEVADELARALIKAPSSQLWRLTPMAENA